MGKNKGKAFKILLATACIVFISGCSLAGGTEKIVATDINSFGESQEVTEQNLKDFASGVLAPSSEEDMQEALDILLPYMTESEYTTLKSELTFIDEECRVVNCTIHYGSEGNVETGTKQLIDAKVDYGEYNKLYLIELSINSEGKINGHKIWVH